MALPSDIVAAAKQIFRVGDVSYRRSNSEALMFKLASALNFVSDRVLYNERTSFGGYFRPTSIDQFSEKIYIQRRSLISLYTMSVGHTDNAGSNSMNFAVYDANGAFLQNLFSTAPIINQTSLDQPLLGRDIDNATVIQQVTTNTTYGTLALTELQEGYTLVPFIVSNASDSIGLFFNLFLKPQE